MKAIKNITFIFAALGILQGCKQDDSLDLRPEDRLNEKAEFTGYVNLQSAGQVYFSQDFNSSTDYTDYIGTGPDLFDAIPTVGNVTINTLNNKLQVVKSEGAGNNRGGFTRSTPLPGGPAGFLKYSMEVTISNNHVDITNGFQFTVGEIPSTAPAAPGDGVIHSILRVNPSQNPGEFTLVSGSQTQQTSMPFSGTRTLVWYINNSGAPAGYTAPDGSIASLQDDAADIWVVDAGTQTLAIDEAPAVTPDKELNSFKLANNPSFTATIDIDNIVLSEEPVVVIPEIVSVAQAAPVEVPIKVSFDLLPLPAELEVTYNDGVKEMAQIQWNPGPGNYNKYLLGQYTAAGTIIPNNGTINPDNISVETTVTIRDELKIANAFTPNNDGKNDTWINPELKYYRNSSVEVFDRDGVRLFHTTNPEEGWDGRNQHGQILAGPYSYIIKVQDLSLVKEGILTVIK